MLPRGRVPDTPAVSSRQSTSGLANTHGDDSDSRVSMGTQAREKLASKWTPPVGIWDFFLYVNTSARSDPACPPTGKPFPAAGLSGRHKESVPVLRPEVVPKPCARETRKCFRQ
jgi:hypothetical protein